MFPPSFPVPAQSNTGCPNVQSPIAPCRHCTRSQCSNVFQGADVRYIPRRLPSLCQALSCFNCFRFSKTNGLFSAICPSVGHPSICPQSAHVSSPFSRTQLCTGQSLSQKGVLAPSMRHPVQLIMSGVIVTPLSFVQSATVFSRRALSFVIVAILASQASQSSPQQPIRWFVFFIVACIN